MKSIYTKRGDEGETGLLYGGRVSKSDQRVAAYGASDEAVSALGLARALSNDPWVRARIMDVQRDLFTVGSELATAKDSHHLLEQHFSPVTPEMTQRLEEWIDWISSQVEMPRSFIIPGATPASGAIDLARATIRRTEREAVRLDESGELANQEILRYLNRLADFAFMLARYEDRHLPPELLTGTKGEPGK